MKIGKLQQANAFDNLKKNFIHIDFNYIGRGNANQNRLANKSEKNKN